MACRKPQEQEDCGVRVTTTQSRNGLGPLQTEQHLPPPAPAAEAGGSHRRHSLGLDPCLALSGEESAQSFSSLGSTHTPLVSPFPESREGTRRGVSLGQGGGLLGRTCVISLNCRTCAGLVLWGRRVTVLGAGGTVALAPDCAWVVLGLWHDAQGTEQGGGVFPGLCGAGAKGVWPGRLQEAAGFEYSLVSQEGLSRPRSADTQVLGV